MEILPGYLTSKDLDDIYNSQNFWKQKSLENKINDKEKAILDLQEIQTWKKWDTQSYGRQRKKQMDLIFYYCYRLSDELIIDDDIFDLVKDNVILNINFWTLPFTKLFITTYAEKIKNSKNKDLVNKATKKIENLQDKYHAYYLFCALYDISDVSFEIFKTNYIKLDHPTIQHYMLEQYFKNRPLIKNEIKELLNATSINNLQANNTYRLFIYYFPDEELFDILLNEKKCNFNDAIDNIEYQRKFLKVRKSIEERFNCELNDLKEKTNIINKTYGNKFSFEQLYGKNDFSIIVQESLINDRNSFNTLTEKCIRRTHDLYGLDYKLTYYSIIIKGLQEAKILSDIIEGLIPSEIFWAMEKQKENGYTFNEHEQKCYDYLEAVATFYLDETKPFAECLNNLNFAVEKVKKLGGKSWINTKK